MGEKYTASGRPVYSMRLGKTERALLTAAAAVRGERVSSFIRRSALEAARQVLAVETRPK